MDRIDIDDADGFFEKVAGTERSQAATMILDPGQSTGGPENTHSLSDQWLFVVSGTGSATIDGETYDLSPGTLVLIEPGEPHEIRAGDVETLETLSVYAPPAY